jgi:hypothetical protein
MPFIQPMPLGRKPEPFDHPEWIYELKYDGLRALAALEYGRCALFLPQWASVRLFLGTSLANRLRADASKRGAGWEIVCLDQEGPCNLESLVLP